MGRSFVISLALCAGCWDQPQLRLDVSRDLMTDNMFVSVCEPDFTTRCNGMAAFPNETEKSRPVSIFTSSPAIGLELTSNSTPQGLCFLVHLASGEVVRDVEVHDMSIGWCEKSTGCESVVTCP